MTFQEVVEWSASSGCRRLDEAARALKCTTSCGMCMPYVTRALETGRTVFHEILPLRRGGAQE